MPDEHSAISTPVRTASDFVGELDGFSGTEHHYRHPFGRLLYTDGVRHLAQASDGVIAEGGGRCGGSYWLIDAIASHQPKAQAACDGFQLWTLTVTATADTRRALLTCRSDSDQPPVVTQAIDITDFPLPEVQLYVVDNVLLLPGEY
ncbi:MAG: DUF6876 family protein [Thermoanaerobaculia bacterium]